MKLPEPTHYNPAGKPFYTEAQCKQIQRDALEAAAQLIDAQVNDANKKGEAAKTNKARDIWSAVVQTAHISRTAIRNMAKEIV